MDIIEYIGDRCIAYDCLDGMDDISVIYNATDMYGNARVTRNTEGLYNISIIVGDVPVDRANAHIIIATCAGMQLNAHPYLFSEIFSLLISFRFDVYTEAMFLNVPEHLASRVLLLLRCISTAYRFSGVPMANSGMMH